MMDLGLPIPAELAAQFSAEHNSLGNHNTSTERRICRKYSVLVHNASPEYVMEFARQLLFTYSHRWQAYEVIAAHKSAFARLDADTLEELGQGIDSWWSVDAFARTLSGPAWVRGLVPDELFTRWAHSPDFWWRRAALVSTVAFNMRSHGGTGDTPRTIYLCSLLASDHEDMVVKALSWALRELAYFDRAAVQVFLAENHAALASRVKREVGNKLNTGLKYPKKTG